jgi:hypothetical protein
MGGADTYASYIDYSRIKTEGCYKSMWVLTDLKVTKTNPFGKQYKSFVSKNLIDCQGSRYQITAFYDYTEQMSGGEVVYSTNYQIKESDWKYPPPNSIGDKLINKACDRK